MRLQIEVHLNNVTAVKSLQRERTLGLRWVNSANLVPSVLPMMTIMAGGEDSNQVCHRGRVPPSSRYSRDGRRRPTAAKQ